MTKRIPTSIEPAAGPRQPAAAPSKKSAEAAPKKTAKRISKPAAPVKPDASRPKKDQLIALLQSPAGTTIDAMTTQTGWQAHTVRAVISAVLRKKLGLTVVCERTELGHLYKIAKPA